MNAEFEKLYLDWYRKTAFLSVGNFEHETWLKLVEWSKEHVSEAVEGVRELISDEPNQVVRLLNEIIENPPTAEGYVPLDAWCNLWIAIIDSSNDMKAMKSLDKIDDHYEEYKAYKKYLDKHYIPWNPFHEDDPNITLEEFKQGKRNDKKLLKQKLKELNKKTKGE